MGVIDYIQLGVLSVFQGQAFWNLFGVDIPTALVMVFFGLLAGIAVGATPGLAGPMAMAVALPILISVFGIREEALLPVFGFLIGIMKGATVGGAVPAILFNTPGTPDAMMTTLDGHPMARAGSPGRALRLAHFSSVSGDTISDIVLFVAAPFLAVFVEAYLDLPEKAALIILSMAFIAAVIGDSVAKGLISASLGLLAAFVATGEDFYPRLTMGIPELAGGFPVVAAVLGVLILGEVFQSIEDMWRQAVVNKPQRGDLPAAPAFSADRLQPGDLKRITPVIFRSAAIGTFIGALPGVGSTLAATLGYTVNRRAAQRRATPGAIRFGDGAPEGIAATEAANSAVSGANLIPVLSLGIPGNAAAVFLILAADSISGFNPGPSVFKFTSPEINPELVVAFGLFTLMAVANLLNWTIGGGLMRAMGIMAKIPRQILMPVVLLVTLTAIYVQQTSFIAIWMAIGFGLLGYLFRRVGITVLPFVIAFILAGPLENTVRQAYSSTGGDPWFLFSSPLATVFMGMAAASVLLLSRRKRTSK